MKAVVLAVVVCFLATVHCLAAEPDPQQARQSPQKLENGVYSVLNESPTEAGAAVDGKPHVVRVYDKKYTEADKNEPVRYIALDSVAYVPLTIEGAPNMEKDSEGKSMLSVKLARENVKKTEDFTRAHLGGQVAIVVGDEIITLHKVRSIISDGHVRITRCTDNACEVIRAKLGD